MMQATILVAEDDAHIREGLLDALESEGYRVHTAADGSEALRAFAREQVDLILLDIMMPGRSGFDVCRDIRSQDPRVPIIMLTAKGEEADKVIGLKLGADDYVTKPFGLRELLARIDAVLRRCAPPPPAAGPPLPQQFVFGALTVDAKQYRGHREGGVIDLTPRELQLIEQFRRHPGEVLSRDKLLNAVWGVTYYGTTRTLDQHIAQLRKKVEPHPPTPTIITTVHGVGYRYEPPATGAPPQH